MEINGVLNLYKPKGYTSHDCIAIVRRAIGVKRVGHTGTLDPMAEGVLPICVGKATRMIEYYDGDFKTYVCKMKLGISTNTLDIWGEVLEDRTKEAENLIKEGLITRKIIEEKIKSFVGENMQVPPKFSALKVEGKRLYEYARAGLEVKIKARPVYIREMCLISFDEKNMEISFEAVCSKGTYVRTICEDLAYKLGTVASMTALTRVASGVFKLAETVSMKEIKSIAELKNSQEILVEKLIDVDKTLENLGEIVIKEKKQHFFLNGVKLFESDVSLIKMPKYSEEKPPHKIPDFLKAVYKAYSSETMSRKFLGIAFFDELNRVYKAEKILFTKQEKNGNI